MTQTAATQSHHPILQGHGYGRYTAYLHGQRIGEVYGKDYADAVREYHRLLDERRQAPAAVDWVSCQGCGLVLDAGQSCPECGEVE